MVSGFHAMVSRFHVLHFGFLDNGTLVLDSNRGWIRDSLSCIPGSKAQDSAFQSKTLLFSEFHKQNFRGFRTPPGFQTDFERKKSCKEIPREKTSCSEKKISLVGYNAGKILTPLYIGEKNSIPNSLNFRQSLRVVFSSQQITHILAKKSNGRPLTKSLVPDYHD